MAEGIGDSVWFVEGEWRFKKTSQGVGRGREVESGGTKWERNRTKRKETLPTQISFALD